MTIIFIILGIIAFGAYFFPTIFAFMAGSGVKRYVFLINLLFGWSVIGWAVALLIPIFELD